MKYSKAKTMNWTVLTSCLVLIFGCGQSNLFEVSDLASNSSTHLLPVPFKINVREETPEERQQEGQHSGAAIYVLDQINRGNKAVRTNGQINNTAQRSCLTCGVENSDYRFKDARECNSQNNYLENEMSNLAAGNSLLGRLINQNVESNSIIKPQCIRDSLEVTLGPSSKSFAQCSASGRNLGAAFRPCITGNYFRLINNSFEAVSACMKDYMMDDVGPHDPSLTADELASLERNKNLNVLSAYSMINIESSFHVNAQNHRSKASGIGAFTDVAIVDVNNVEISNIRQALENNKNPDIAQTCRDMSLDLLDSATPMRSSSANSCDRISLKNGNPLTNMIYTYGYMKIAKDSMKRNIFSDPNLRAKFDLSAEEIETVKRALMIMSHNAGPKGAWTPAISLLNSEYRKRKVTSSADFIARMRAAMRSFPASSNRSAARRSETSGYYPKIDRTLNLLEQTAGGGSCIN